MTTLLTVSDVARMCKLSPSTIYSRKEKIGYLKIGGAVRFRPEDVAQYLDGCKVCGRPAQKRKKKLKLKCLSL